MQLSMFPENTSVMSVQFYSIYKTQVLQTNKKCLFPPEPPIAWKTLSPLIIPKLRKAQNGLDADRWLQDKLLMYNFLSSN